MRASTIAILTMSVALATACTGDETTTPAEGGGAGDDSGGGDGGHPDAEYTALITGEWELDPFSEKTDETYLLTIERDIFIGAIRPIAPTGTHHTTLGTTYLGEKEGIFAAGLGTNELVFPPGVGLRLTAGTTLVLELHLFNPSDAVLTGTSGVEIVEVAPEDVVEEAGVYAPGPMELTIPPNEETTETGTCTVLEPFTIIAMLPHMHQLGTHLKTTIETDEGSTVIHDEAFSFDQQFVRPVEPIEVQFGDKIKTACTYENTTSELVSWGTNSTDEMCFSILYRYPAHNDSGFCTE